MTNKLVLVQVAAYQTTDGKAHTTRSAAAAHQARINLRSFFNKYVSGTARSTDKIEINELLTLVERNRHELAELLRSQTSELGRIEKLEKTLASKKTNGKLEAA